LFDPIEWSALAIDMRGRGESGGEYCSFGESRCADLTAWLDWSRAELGEVERVVVWGRSMGAGLALRFAMAGTRRVDCLVVEAPFANLSGVVSGWLRRKWLPGFAAKAMVWRAGRIAGGAIDEPTPLAAAACVRVPVLILHGARDGLAPLSEAESICRAIGPSAKLVVVPEAGHADVFELGRGAVEVGLRELIDGDVHDQ
jgi:pimeloyl-ACP methyl ester carboxylesterase